MIPMNRSNVAAYVAADRHLRGGLRGAKTLTQMAAELGTSKSTREALASARSLGPLDGELGVG
jgi:hypothetical protein